MNFRKYSDIQLNYQEATAAQAEMLRSKAGKGIGNGWKGIWGGGLGWEGKMEVFGALERERLRVFKVVR